jgi:hypothetical protein
VAIISCVFAFAPTLGLVIKVVYNSLEPWRPWDKEASRRAVTAASGALKRSPNPFGVWTGHRASGQSRPLASTDHRIPLSSCGNTLSPFEQLEAMGAS